MKRNAKALYFLPTAVLALGFFVLDGGAALAQQGTPFSGTWSGSVDQADVDAYDVEIEFYDDFVTVLYADLDCAGVLENTGAADGRRAFAEHIVIGGENEGGVCVDDGTVQLDIRGGFLTYRWFWPDGELGATAKLTRVLTE